ncbi:metalloproteinase inhibitor 2-like [Ruditapes philippinarum]|uniref:metalloproteinase inhibitor 2-like n=1 Tax=Ruditapes philippinarum TaxID=129788 RepID=UPI00295AD8DA|nr:metalloproteinase inhibitor 2-like [Ruditapes philippinarum]
MKCCLAVFILISSCVALGDACSCFPATDTEKYCATYNDFAILIQVKNGGQIVQNKRRYKIDLLNIYNITITNTNLQTNFIFTAVEGSLCGITLQNGKFYVLTGTIADGNGNQKILQTLSCDLRIQYDSEADVDFVAPTC